MCSSDLTSVPTGAVFSDATAITGTLTSVAMSSDGSKIYAANSDGAVFKSTDHGQSWTQILSTSYICAVCCSADGTRVYCRNFLLLYTSTNSGASFSSASAPVSGYYSPLACSPSGQILFVGNLNWGSSNNHQFATSQDYGVSWSSLSGLAYSPKVCAGPIYFIGDVTGMGIISLYKSTDNGGSFSAIYSSGLDAVSFGDESIAASYNGAIVYIVTGTGLLKSTDGGSSFISVNTGGGTGVSCSGDGQVVLLLNSGAAVKFSADGGATWGSSNTSALGATVSSDGSIAVTGNFKTSIAQSSSGGAVASKSFACELKGAIKRDAYVATTAILGTVQKNALSDTPTGWDVNATADATNGAISFTATGEASTTVLWKCNVQTVELNS